MTDMYIVRKNGRKIPNKVFATYEKARQWVRKSIRSTFSDFQRGWDLSDNLYRTPAIQRYGYSISKVEG